MKSSRLFFLNRWMVDKLFRFTYLFKKLFSAKQDGDEDVPRQFVWDAERKWELMFVGFTFLAFAVAVIVSLLCTVCSRKFVFH